jgi:hypothetical protein
MNAAIHGTRCWMSVSLPPPTRWSSPITAPSSAWRSAAGGGRVLADHPRHEPDTTQRHGGRGERVDGDARQHDARPRQREIGARREERGEPDHADRVHRGERGREDHLRQRADHAHVHRDRARATNASTESSACWPSSAPENRSTTKPQTPRARARGGVAPREREREHHEQREIGRNAAGRNGASAPWSIGIRTRARRSRRARLTSRSFARRRRIGLIAALGRVEQIHRRAAAQHHEHLLEPAEVDHRIDGGLALQLRARVLDGSTRRRSAGPSGTRRRDPT